MGPQDRTAAADQAAALARLQHRVRNTLAAMRGIVRRSAETSTSLDDYVMHLNGRLDALARVQNAMIRNPLAGLDLGLMLADELAACRAREGERVHIAGPAILLNLRAAEALGLAFHELATNALKFGALAWASGTIDVTWRVVEAVPSRLLLDWVEGGVPDAAGALPRRGFGTLVVREMLPHDLDARTSLAPTPDGLACRIDLPMTDRVLAPA